MDRRIMTSVSVLDGFIFAGTLVALAAVLTRLILRAGILAVPNQRSSHTDPVPNSGGIAIVVTAYAGVLFAWLSGSYFQAVERQLLGLGIASLIIATAGLLDDLGKISNFGAKLAAQILACSVLMGSGVVVSTLPLPFIGEVMLGGWGYPLTALWILSITNICNFMDGLDGLAAGTVVIVAATLGFICLGQGAAYSHVLCFALAAATLGLLMFNFPTARIFMGDVGSQFLGFMLAAIAVLATEFDTSQTSIFVMPLLLFNFIFDTAFTFVRRLRAGENVTQAHRSHLYQLMNQLGYSHARVSLFHFAVALCQAGGAVALVRGDAGHPFLVFLPFVLFQGVYAALIVRATKRREKS